MKKKLNKKMLFSLFSFPLVALPIGLVTISNSNNSVHFISKSLNVNESTTDFSINLEDALPVADTSISSFGDYIVSYEDSNISPANVIIPPFDANQGTSKSGGATVGMTANKQTITLTTYSGVLLWSHKLTENKLLKTYYENVLSLNDISSYKVINFAYLESKKILFVLFGNVSDSGTSNLVVFGLDINSGKIVVPEEAKLNDSQVIGRARNNSAFIFFNTENQLVITSGNLVSDVQNSLKIMSFDEKSGFNNVKGNDADVNNFGNISGTAKTTDYLLGLIPSSVKGINFSIWLYSSVVKGAVSPILSYATGNNDEPRRQSQSSGGVFNYYVLAVKDDFSPIGAFNVINLKPGTNTYYRGYMSIDSSMPSFSDVEKRFFVTTSTGDENSSTNTIGVLLDSYDSMFSSFMTMSIDLTGGETPTVNYTSSQRKIYMNYENEDTANPGNTTTGPSKDDLKPVEKDGQKLGLENDVTVGNWEFSSVGYDKLSNFVYFSLSGEEDKDGANGKYLTNTRYIDLKNETADDKRVSSDAYIETDPYTLSDVNFNTYSDTKNIYLVKQSIDGNSGQWLSTDTDKFNDDAEDFKPTKTSNINFNSLQTLSKNLESSTALNNIMPSNIKPTDLNEYLEANNLANNIKFQNISGNDETGEISFTTEITYPNNFGDDVPNGNVSYVSDIQTKGFTINDFSLTYVDDNADKVKTFKTDYSAAKIVETNNVGWVVENLLQNFTIKNVAVSVTPNMISLKNPESDSLEVTITVPIKKDMNDNSGVLPVGFPANQNVKTIKYSGFTGTEAPPFVELPDNPNNPDNNSNSGDGLSAGAIAGIVIGCLALAAIIIAAIVLIRIRTKSKV
ncbi:MAG: hypothetical protein K2I76_02295, partial [Malacoplasma sp.]|nr:hypothetical protein [Malacoplasma sp.]